MTTTQLAIANLPDLELVAELPYLVGTSLGALIRLCRRREKNADGEWWRYYIGWPRAMLDPIESLRELVECTPYWGVTKNRFAGDVMEGEDADYYYYIQPFTSREGEPVPAEKLNSRVNFYLRQGRMALHLMTS